MPFIDDIIKCKSLSIVGTEKNTGKTECLNYILDRLSEYNLVVAVTSAGIDGETVDQVTSTPKPEIRLAAGTIFSTNEKFYRNRRILAELLDIDQHRTTTGRLITARAMIQGKVLLSGPSTTSALVKWIDSAQREYNADICIIDGALSRLSMASPAISQGLVLATGAAFSTDYETVAEHTSFIVELIQIPQTRLITTGLLNKNERGAWLIGEDGEIEKLTDFNIFSKELPMFNSATAPKGLVLSGAVTDTFLNRVTDSKSYENVELIVEDFTKIFATQNTYRRFLSKGRKLKVLLRSKLIAVCVNPVSPNGVVLDSDRLCREISEKTNVPTYDLLKNGNET